MDGEGEEVVDALVVVDTVEGNVETTNEKNNIYNVNNNNRVRFLVGKVQE